MADNTHEAKIVVNGDATIAVGALKKVEGAISNVRKALSSVTGAFALFHFAANAVGVVVNGYKKFQEWLNKTANAYKELARRMESDRAASAAQSLADHYDRINDSLKKRLELENQINSEMDVRTKKERDMQDARLEAKKQGEIASLDAYDKDYDAKKTAIERKYEIEQGDVAARRASEDSFARVDRYNEEADAKDKAKADLEKELKRARAEKKLAASGGDDKAFETAAKRVQDLLDRIAELGRESSNLRAMAQAEYGSGASAQERADANRQRIQNEASREEAKKDIDHVKENEAKLKRWEDWQQKTARDEKNDAEIAKIEKRKSSLEDLMGAQQGGQLSSNRLTALGLGAGVSNPFQGMGTDVKHIVRLLEKQIEETKKNHAKNEAHIAIFGE